MERNRVAVGSAKTQTPSTLCSAASTAARSASPLTGRSGPFSARTALSLFRPTKSGCAIFVGNEEKVFVIQVEHNMGAVIGMFLRDTPKERPLTHDLITSIFKGFGISVERVVITELKNSTYFARLILKQQNELASQLVEIDARPSDCLALATAQKRPIYVASNLFEQVADMSEVLNKINENGEETE